ncbi:MAG: serine hydrolase domain-containing protein [Ginsengibacter sp.]
MKKLNKFILVSALVFSFSACKKTDVNVPPPPPQQKDISSVDQKATDWMTKNKMPGLSLAVSKDGKLVYAKGYGEANTDTHEKVTTESQFRIASVSKLLTSVAIMKLVENGKVAMDQKVFGTNGVLGTTYGTQPYNQYITDITISELLHHTGGGWGQDNDPAFFDITQDKPAIINYTLNNIPLKRSPGSGFDYSNFGYMLLAQVVEKVSGKAYNQFVNDEIWMKTGATHSSIAGSKLSDKLPIEVVYYGQGNEGQYVYNTNLARGDGAMGWLSTPSDLLRFATAVDGSSTRPDILSAATIKTMTTTSSASIGFGFHFGCGWVVEGDEWFWWGSLPGTFAMLYRNENGICIAATANSRVQPTPENALNSFIGVINFLASTNDIPWQDIDQFK